MSQVQATGPRFEVMMLWPGMIEDLGREWQPRPAVHGCNLTYPDAEAVAADHLQGGDIDLETLVVRHTHLEGAGELLQGVQDIERGGRRERRPRPLTGGGERLPGPFNITRVPPFRDPALDRQPVRGGREPGGHD